MAPTPDTVTEGVGADDVVIGEAVALDVPIVGFGIRLLGGLIDAGIAIALMIALVMTLFAYAISVSSAIATVIIILIFMVPLLIIPALLETFTRGRTIGKLATGTRIVRDDNGPITFRHALIRALVGLVEFWGTGFGVAIVACLVNRRGKRLGDMAAGTVLIKERMPLRFTAPLPMPPHLARWAAAADVATLPPAVAMNIRQFLMRRNQLSPVARARLSDRLALQLRDHVSPPPPPCHVEDFLAAVVAERGRRDRRRLADNRALRDRLLGA